MKTVLRTFLFFGPAIVSGFLFAEETKTKNPARPVEKLTQAHPKKEEVSGGMRLGYCNAAKIYQSIPAVEAERVAVEEELRPKFKELDEKRNHLINKAKNNGFASEEEFAKAEEAWRNEAGMVKRQIDSRMMAIGQKFDDILRNAAKSVRENKGLRIVISSDVVLAGVPMDDVTDAVLELVKKEYDKKKKEQKWVKEPSTPAIPNTALKA